MENCINQDTIDELLEVGGEAFLAEIITIFDRNLDDRIVKVDAAFAAEDQEQLHFHFHSMKSSAGNLGADILYTFAEDCEKKIQSGESLTAENIDSFKAHCENARKALLQLIKK